MDSRTEIGPHDLIVSPGDCTLTGTCSCGAYISQVRVDQPLRLMQRWDIHVVIDHRDCTCDWHQL